MKLIDSNIKALRAFAEVSRNHDAADAWDLQQALESHVRDESKVIDEVNRYCQAAP